MFISMDWRILFIGYVIDDGDINYATYMYILYARIISKGADLVLVVLGRLITTHAWVWLF